MADATELLEDFHNQISIFEGFKDKMHSVLKDLLHVNSIIPHQIICRVKEKDSLIGKVERKKDKYTSLQDITDIVGIRIITYFEDDVDRIAQIVEKEFEVDKLNSIDKRILEADKFGYRSLHFVVSLSKSRLRLTENKMYKGQKAEIQIRSILQHAWAEIEHDIGYKGETQIPEFARRGFYRIAALLETADIEFVKLKDSLKKYEVDVSKEIKNNPETVKLDKASFVKYINSSLVVRAIEQNAQRLLKSNGIEENHQVLDMYLERLNYFEISTIKELDDLLLLYREQLPKFISKIFPESDKGVLPRGISTFYLAYILSSKDENLSFTQEFINKMFGQNKSFENFAKELIQIYKDTKNSS